MHGACIYDYIEISYEGFSWKYCGDGSNIQKPFISSGSTMTIKFHSDSDVSGTGFFATWEEINCKPFSKRSDIHKALDLIYIKSSSTN